MSGGDSYGGIGVPEGDPEGLRGAAGRVRASAGVLEASGGVLQSMLGGLGWAGPASASHSRLTSMQAMMARTAVAALNSQAAVISEYAETLEAGQRQAERAIDDARDADRRIRLAEEEIEQAQADQRAARARIEAAQAAKALADDRLASAVIDVLAGDSSAAVASEAAAREIREAQRDLEDAERRERRARRLLEQARDDRRDAQKRGEEAAESVEIARGGLVAAAQYVGFLPTQPGGPANPAFAAAAGIALPPPPKPPQEDKPWYEDAAIAAVGAASWTWGQARQVPGGAWEGTKGIYEGGKFLYEASPSLANLLLERERTVQRWAQLGQAGQYAWDNPGEFAKQLVNYEDLAAGRYGEWLGNLAPDAVLAVTTAGAGTAASRTARTTDTIADTAEAARRVDVTSATQRAASSSARPPLPEVREGLEVFRYWGDKQEADGSLRLQEGAQLADGGSVPEGARSMGRSWTTAAPETMPDPRANLGLPDANPARFLSRGVLVDPTGVLARQALEFDGQHGGWPELLIPDPERQVELRSVEGVNPEP